MMRRGATVHHEIGGDESSSSAMVLPPPPPSRRPARTTLKKTSAGEVLSCRNLSIEGATRPHALNQGETVDAKKHDVLPAAPTLGGRRSLLEESGSRSGRVAHRRDAQISRASMSGEASGMHGTWPPRLSPWAGTAKDIRHHCATITRVLGLVPQAPHELGFRFSPARLPSVLYTWLQRGVSDSIDRIVTS
jgi:hypothetical protein